MLEVGIRARNASYANFDHLGPFWTICLRSILRRMYTNYAQQKGWSAKRSSFTEGLPACEAFETFSHAVQARWKLFPAPKISGTCAWRFMVNLSYSHTRLYIQSYTAFDIFWSHGWYRSWGYAFVLFCLYGGDTIGLKSQDLGISWNLMEFEGQWSDSNLPALHAFPKVWSLRLQAGEDEMPNQRGVVNLWFLSRWLCLWHDATRDRHTQAALNDGNFAICEDCCGNRRWNSRPHGITGDGSKVPVNAMGS